MEAQAKVSDGAAIPAKLRRLYETIDTCLLEFGSLAPRQQAIMTLAKELNVDKAQLKELVDRARASHPQINAVARVHKLIENAKASGQKPDLSMFRRLQPAAKSAGKDDLWLGEQLGYIPQFLEKAALEKKEGKKKSKVLPISLGVLVVIVAIGGLVWQQTYGDLLAEQNAQIELDNGAWAEAESAANVAAYEGYLRNHPGGLHVDAAKQRITELDKQAWHKASLENTRDAYENYIAQFSVHGDEALQLMDGRLPGDIFRDCVGCPEMVVVKAGQFEMGSTQGDDDELPVHKVDILQPFAVGIFEVSFSEWDLCALKKGCDPDIYDSEFGRGNRPVINVSWDEAQTYISWLSKESGVNYRLPSEAEWEYANRAGSTDEYWWGARFAMDRAVCTGCESSWVTESTADVGKYKGNPFGLIDTAGNVSEWVADCRHNNYEGAPADGSAWLAESAGDCTQAVIRGGSWLSGAAEVRSADRVFANKDYSDNTIGFRVARVIN